MDLAKILAVLLLGFVASPASGQVSPGERSRVELFPHVGATEGGNLLGLLGLGVGVPLGSWVTIAGSAQRWSFSTACPDVAPSTCGDDGWSLDIGPRLDLDIGGRLRPFLEARAGGYRFRGKSRDGHLTWSLGGRVGVALRVTEGVEWEVAGEARRLGGYARTGLDYPSIVVKGISLGVRLNLGAETRR